MVLLHRGPYHGPILGWSGLVISAICFLAVAGVVYIFVPLESRLPSPEVLWRFTRPFGSAGATNEQTVEQRASAAVAGELSAVKRRKMPRFVALLRGVNVGRAKRVPMAGLRALLSGLGYTGVATLLNSGNAVFRAPRGTPAKHSADIAAAISTQLRVEVTVIVKSARELAAVIAENPTFGAALDAEEGAQKRTW